MGKTWWIPCTFVPYVANESKHTRQKNYGKHLPTDKIDARKQSYIFLRRAPSLSRRRGCHACCSQQPISRVLVSPLIGLGNVWKFPELSSWPLEPPSVIQLIPFWNILWGFKCRCGAMTEQFACSFSCECYTIYVCSERWNCTVFLNYKNSMWFSGRSTCNWI